MDFRAALVAGSFALTGACGATTLEQVKAGLQEAKRRALATSFEAAESFENAFQEPWGRGSPVFARGVQRRDLSSLANDQSKWQLVPARPSCRWAVSGERFGSWQEGVTMVSDGHRTWRRHPVPAEAGETIWLAEELRPKDSQAELARWTADPISVGYRYPAIDNGDPSEIPRRWLSDVVERCLRATVKDLPNGRVRLNLVEEEPYWECYLFGSGGIGPGTFYWHPGSEAVAVLDPGRGYLAESISICEVEVNLSTSEVPLTLVQDVRKVGDLWVPTRYMVARGWVSIAGSGGAFRVTVSDIRRNPSEIRFRAPFKEGDLRGTDISSPDERPERLSGSGTWEWQPSKHEKEQTRATLEYGLYVAGLVGVISAAYSVPSLIRRRLKRR